LSGISGAVVVEGPAQGPDILRFIVAVKGLLMGNDLETTLLTRSCLDRKDRGGGDNASIIVIAFAAAPARVDWAFVLQQWV
jgi:hypothetical protein